MSHTVFVTSDAMPGTELPPNVANRCTTVRPRCRWPVNHASRTRQPSWEKYALRSRRYATIGSPGLVSAR